MMNLNSKACFRIRKIEEQQNASQCIIRYNCIYKIQSTRTPGKMSILRQQIV